MKRCSTLVNSMKNSGDKLKINPAYLDNNATTPRDPRVTKYYCDIEKKFFGNASSNHIFGWQAKEIINISKDHIAKLVNCDPEMIYFTSGATEANNLAIMGYYNNKVNLSKISMLSTKIEHSSILHCLDHLKNNHNVHIKFLATDNKGHVIAPLRDLESSTNLISVHLANNEIGTIQKIKELRNFLPKSFIHSDCSQALGKIQIDMCDMQVNCISISAHKLYGPVGIGAIIFKDISSRNEVHPLLFGGNQQDSIRPGTIPTALIGAFGKAAEIAYNDFQKNNRKIQKLSKFFLENIKTHFPEIKLIGDDINTRLPGNLSLYLPGINAAKLQSKLATRFAFSTGAACYSSNSRNSHVLEEIIHEDKMRNEIIRIGIGKFNTKNEISSLVKEIANFKC